MLSTSHPDAAFYFERDIVCLKRFFLRRFGFESDEPGPFLADAVGVRSERRLDVEAEASGFSRKMARELEGYMNEVGVDGDGVRGAEREGDEVGSEEENGDDDGQEDGGLEEALGEVKSPDRDDVVDGMMILKLADESVSAATSEIQMKEAISAPGVASGGKIRTNTAKAAKGWII